MKRIIIFIITILSTNPLLAQAVDSTKVITIVEDKFWSLAWHGTNSLWGALSGIAVLGVIVGSFWLLMKSLASEFVKDKFAEYAEGDIKMVKSFFDERKKLFEKRSNKSILIINNAQGTRLNLSTLLDDNGYKKVAFRALTTLNNSNKHLKTLIDENSYKIVIFDMIDNDLTMDIVREPNRDYLSTLKETVKMLCITPNTLTQEDFDYAKTNKVMALQLWESRLIQELDSML